MRLCSDFNAEQEVVCDLPKGHRGPHKAAILWGDWDEVIADEEDKEAA